MQQVKDSSTAMTLDKKLNYETDGDLLFSAPRVAAIGVIRQSGKAEIIADAALNGGVQGVAMRPEFNAVYVGEQATAPVAWVVNWDDGCGSSGGFSASSDQSEDRQQCIVNQVRFAATAAEMELALSAAYMYDCVLAKSLISVYGLKFSG